MIWTYPFGESVDWYLRKVLLGSMRTKLKNIAVMLCLGRWPASSSHFLDKFSSSRIKDCGREGLVIFQGLDLIALTRLLT